MFTAIAMVVFVGSSMAETSEKSEQAAKEVKQVKKNKDTKESDCRAIKKLAYDLAISEGANDCSAENYADGVYATCMKL